MAVKLRRLLAGNLLSASSPVRRICCIIHPRYDAQQCQKLTKRPHLSKHVVLELLEEVHCKSFKTMPLESGNPSIAPLAVQSLAGISKRLEKGNLQLCARGLCTYIHQQAACFYGGMCSTRMQDCESQSAMMKEKPQKVDGLQCRMPPTSPFALSLEHLPSLKLTR